MNYIIQIKPLSINEAFKGRRFRSSKYDIFIIRVLKMLPDKVIIPDEKNIKLALEFGFSSSRSDIDNGIKTFVDCLVKKYGVDDRYIYELHVFKKVVEKGEEFIKFKIY